MKGISGGRSGMNELRVERTNEYDRDKHDELQVLDVTTVRVTGDQSRMIH